jgi:monofunctional biosynthetic peptidoglycan transglycosylase
VNKSSIAVARRRRRFKEKPAARKFIPGRWFRRVIRYVLLCAAAFYALIAFALVLLRFFAPLTTAVQTERRVHAWMQDASYRKNYRYVPLSGISPHLIHAAIAAEDARFFEHHGFDWKEVGAAIQQDVEQGRRRGASTITQQLVRNLFLSTGPSILRKALEFSIVPLTEAILPKNRILELYLNVVEWCAGIYGAEAASQVYYRRPARQLSRDQALELVSLLPAPLHRRPGQVEWYVARIRQRMAQMNW